MYICRLCHRALHKQFDEMALAKSMNTVELVRADESMKKTLCVGGKAKGGRLMKVSVRVVRIRLKNEVVGLYDGVLKVKVCAVPEKGKANKAVIELLA